MKRLIVALAVAASACSPGADQAQAQPQSQPQAQAAVALPDVTAVRTIGADGKPTLEGWSSTEPPKDAGILRYSLHIEPRAKEFAGAKTFSSALRGADAVAAAKKAASVEGFETTKVLAEGKVKPEVMTRLEKGSWATSLMLEGKMGGKPAKFIGTVWYGAWGEKDGKANTGVSGFAAPDAVFKALGGYAVPAILFNNARATANTKMSVGGGKPPQQQVTELSDLFAGWAATLGRDDLSGLAANTIMNGNLGPKAATGCIYTTGCVGGGMPSVRMPNN